MVAPTLGFRSISLKAYIYQTFDIGILDDLEAGLLNRCITGRLPPTGFILLIDISLSFLITAHRPYGPDIVKHPLHIPLRTVTPAWIVIRVAVLRVAALASGAMDIDHGHPVHRTQSPAAAHVDGKTRTAVETKKGGTGPMEREGSQAVEINISVDEDILVWAVEGLLHRALSNILINAIRYAGDHGPVEITAKRNGDRVIIEVTDRGPGVPEASIERLFEPFYRPQAGRERKSGGVGLGLAIVKTCIQSCKGTVQARNLSPKGFSVTLELVASQP